MILQALHQLYGRLERDLTTGLPKPNHSVQDISYKVVLSNGGASYQIQDIRDAVVRKNRNGRETTNLVPIQLILPGDARASERSYTPCVLWDDTRFLFGWHGRQDDQTNNRRCFESFKTFHLAHEVEISSPSFSAVCTFLKNWNPEDAPDDPVLAMLKLGRGVFQMQGEIGYVHDDSAFVRWWTSQGQSSEEELRGQCLVTGKKDAVIAQTHPGIFGIPGAAYNGSAIVSFNERAYESYGFVDAQGYNSPVSKDAAFRYAAALNWLLESNRQRLRIGDASAVFWTDEPSQVETMLPFLLDSGLAPQDPALIALINAALENIASGKLVRSSFGKPETPYFILGLVLANKGRLSVRFWHTSTLGHLAVNLQRHQHDLAIERQWDETNSKRPEPKVPGIYALLKQTARDADGIPPLLGGALIRAILLGTNYPDALFQKVMSRVRVAEKDQNDNPAERVNYLRAAIIKAYLNRNHNLNLTMSLDTTRIDIAYLLGRLFAVLEKTQQDALPDINATIRDRFYSAASATPGVVFPRVFRTYTHHLNKAAVEYGQGYKVNREILVGEIKDKFDNYPMHFNLQQQGQFAIGYYHQRKALFPKRDKPDATHE